MIQKIVLSPDDDLAPVIVLWDNELEDYKVDIPKGLSREALIDLVEEIKRITEWYEE